MISTSLQIIMKIVDLNFSKSYGTISKLSTLHKRFELLHEEFYGNVFKFFPQLRRVYIGSMNDHG